MQSRRSKVSLAGAAIVAVTAPKRNARRRCVRFFFQQKFNFFVTDLLMVVSDAIVGIVGWTIGGHTTCCVQNLRSCGYFAGNLGLELIGIMRKNRGSTEKEEVIIISSPRISETLAPVSSVLGERRPVLLLHCHKDLIFTACIHHRLS